MYAELLSRSNFSFLRGASHPEELVEAAAALGYAALGIADLDGVYGCARAFARARELGAPLHVVYGAELTLERGGERGGLTLLARDKAGWSLLCRLLTASHAGKPKGEAGLDWAAFLAQAGGAGGHLLALPRGAGLGERFLDDGEGVYGPLRELFGADLLVPLLRCLDGRDAERTRGADALCARYGAVAVATADAHYHAPGRRRLHDALACVRGHCTLEEAGWRLQPNAERRLQAPAEMARRFAERPQALRAGVEAAARCAFSLDELRYRYPGEWVPAGHSAQSWLEQLAEQGARRRWPQGPPEESRRLLRHELGVVARLGHADYFLTIHEAVQFARDRGILCQGRGSAANSVLCYCLGITAIDPVRMGLLFERFMSEERAEPPDIDVDFEHSRREEVIQHLYEKYGRHRAAMVSAVRTYRTRSAIGELSKALGSPQRAQGPQGDARAPGEADPLLQALAAELHGFPRHLSIHSGGFVLSGEPLSDLVPIEPARMPGRSIIQWDKHDLDALGFMKVDVLALGMLSALKGCLQGLGWQDLAQVPAEDPGTYAMIQRADTLGVFQIESRAQMNMLGRLRPEHFYDLVIQVAIVRPGPIVGQMVHPYLKRRKGEEPVRYEHPALERILGKTLGVPLFQEQVMRIAVELGGFSPGEADQLRRAISSWRGDGRLNALGARLQQGLRAAGLSQGFCERLFAEIKGFAEYGFPESHAASFALLVYASCWFKHRHPALFACAMLNAQPLGFYAPHSLVDDAKRHGVAVLPPDPARSGWDCALEDGRLRLGLRVVEGLGEARAQALLEAREARPFAGLEDFVQRSGLPFGVLQRLALAGAFEAWGWPDREALWRLLALRGLQADAEPGGQLSLGLGPGVAAGPAGFDRLDPGQALERDYQAFGLSVRAHPMQWLRAQQRRPWPTLAALKADGRQDAHAEAAGLLIVRQRPSTAHGVVFATLEDESGLLDLVLWPKVYERYREILLGQAFLRARGRLQKDRDAVSLLVEALAPLVPDDSTRPGLRLRSHDWH